MICYLKKKKIKSNRDCIDWLQNEPKSMGSLGLRNFVVVGRIDFIYVLSHKFKVHCDWIDQLPFTNVCEFELISKPRL